MRAGGVDEFLSSRPDGGRRLEADGSGRWLLALAGAWLQTGNITSMLTRLRLAPPGQPDRQCRRATGQVRLVKQGLSSEGFVCQPARWDAAVERTRALAAAGRLQV